MSADLQQTVSEFHQFCITTLETFKKDFPDLVLDPKQQQTREQVIAGLQEIINSKPFKRTFDFYEDPGHGWVKVKRALLIELGIEHQVSSCSYQRKEHVYLEEDVDLRLLVSALRAKGEQVEFREHHSNKQSRIRCYEPFCPTTENMRLRDLLEVHDFKNIASTDDWLELMRANQEKVDEIDVKAKAKGDLLWRVISPQVFDGFAHYQVVGVYGRNVQVEHLSLGDDNYIFDVWGDGCLVDKEYIQRLLARKDALADIFSK